MFYLSNNDIGCDKLYRVHTPLSVSLFLSVYISLSNKPFFVRNIQAMQKTNQVKNKKRQSMILISRRYNQISSHCAEHLCKMIHRNKVLKSIDLSWNILGLQGGRLLLKAICENKIITNLVLYGNSIPEDITLAIKKQLRENRHRYSITEIALSVDAKFMKFPMGTMGKDFIMSMSTGDLEIAHSEQKHLISYQKEKIKTDILQASADVKINDRINPSEINSKINTELEDNNNNSNARVNISSRDHDNNRTIETDAKIADLGKMLQERTAIIDLLNGELTIKIAEVDDMRAQLNLLQTEINQLQEEKERFDLDKAKEIAELRKSHDEAKRNWQKSYEDLKNDYNERSQYKKEANSKVKLIKFMVLLKICF